MTVLDSPQANFIAGKWVRSDQLIDNINPATGETFAQVCLASVTDVETAVTAGQKAFDTGLRRYGSCGTWPYTSADQ